MKKVIILASFIGSGMSNQRFVAESMSELFVEQNPKTVFSPMLGVTMNVKFNDYLAIQPGLQYAMMGNKNEYDYTMDLFLFSTTVTGSTQSTTHNIQLPLLLKGQYPINDKVAVGIGVGPYVGLFLGGKSKIVGNGESTTITIKSRKELSKEEAGDIDFGTDFPSEEEFAKEVFTYAQPLDFGIVIAPYIEFNNFQIALNYNVGLTNQSSQYKGRSYGAYKTYNNWYGITAAYFFGGKQ